MRRAIGRELNPVHPDPTFENVRATQQAGVKLPYRAVRASDHTAVTSAIDNAVGREQHRLFGRREGAQWRFSGDIAGGSVMAKIRTTGSILQIVSAVVFEHRHAFIPTKV